MTKEERLEKKKYKHFNQEQKLIPKMVKIYCHGHKHQRENKKGLCPDCQELLDYSLFRLSKCPFKENKKFCSFCKIHCYKPDMKVRIKEVMKYSGPKMLFSQPIFSISHVVQMIKYKKSIKKANKEKEINKDK